MSSYIANEINPVKFKTPKAIPKITLNTNLNQNILSNLSSLVFSNETCSIIRKINYIMIIFVY
jgi:hypothetical protein